MTERERRESQIDEVVIVMDTAQLKQRQMITGKIVLREREREREREMVKVDE